MSVVHTPVLNSTTNNSLNSIPTEVRNMANFRLGCTTSKNTSRSFLSLPLHDKSKMRKITTRKLMKQQTTKKMMVIVVKIQWSIVGEISNKKPIRHQDVPWVLIRRNVQGMTRHHIIQNSPSKDAMHVILLRMVVTPESSIITSYAMLMPSSK